MSYGLPCGMNSLTYYLEWEGIMETILSLGAGVQSTALAIMVARGEIKVDAVVFADTGAEKPETYYMIDEYIAPMLKAASIPFHKVKNQRETLYEYCWRFSIVPSVLHRWCTVKFKVQPITKLVGKECVMLIGFSTEESHRVKNETNREFPLIERNMTVTDCRHIIQDMGWPVPTKSSCYFCVFQSPPEWNWMKIHHPELIERALELEAHSHEKKPHQRHKYGLLRGFPLWKFAQGIQEPLAFAGEYSCWDGWCGR